MDWQYDTSIPIYASLKCIICINNVNYYSAPTIITIIFIFFLASPLILYTFICLLEKNKINMSSKLQDKNDKRAAALRDNLKRRKEKAKEEKEQKKDDQKKDA